MSMEQDFETRVKTKAVSFSRTFKDIAPELKEFSLSLNRTPVLFVEMQNPETHVGIAMFSKDEKGNYKFRTIDHLTESLYTEYKAQHGKAPGVQSITEVKETIKRAAADLWSHLRSASGYMPEELTDTLGRFKMFLAKNGIADLTPGQYWEIIYRNTNEEKFKGDTSFRPKRQDLSIPEKPVESPAESPSKPSTTLAKQEPKKRTKYVPLTLNNLLIAPQDTRSFHNELPPDTKTTAPKQSTETKEPTDPIITATKTRAARKKLKSAESELQVIDKVKDESLPETKISEPLKKVVKDITHAERAFITEAMQRKGNNFSVRETWMMLRLQDLPLSVQTEIRQTKSFGLRNPVIASFALYSDKYREITTLSPEQVPPVWKSLIDELRRDSTFDNLPVRYQSDLMARRIDYGAADEILEKLKEANS